MKEGRRRRTQKEERRKKKRRENREIRRKQKNENVAPIHLRAPSSLPLTRLAAEDGPLGRPPACDALRLSADICIAAVGHFATLRGVAATPPTLLPSKIGRLARGTAGLRGHPYPPGRARGTIPLISPRGRLPYPPTRARGTIPYPPGPTSAINFPAKSAAWRAERPDFRATHTPRGGREGPRPL